MNKNNKVQLEVAGLSYPSNIGNTFALILSEIDGNRRLPILIGERESQSIIMVLEGVITKRPMTHDLFVKLCIEYDIEISEVIIYDVEGGTFFAKLVCEDNEGDIKEIDSRTSDAISLALRFECPIYGYESVMEKSSIEANAPNIKSEPINKKREITKYDIKMLEKDLEDAIKIENFEKAANIRDIISEKRKKKERIKKL